MSQEVALTSHQLCRCLGVGLPTSGPLRNQFLSLLSYHWMFFCFVLVVAQQDKDSAEKTITK